MRIGIISDTHDEIARTRLAVRMLCDAGAKGLIHCGDLSSPPIVAACSALPCWFALGNHDADSVPALKQAALEFGAVCLGWGGIVEIAGKRIGVTHGHLTSDMRQVLAQQPDYLLFGHSHFASDSVVGSARRINPGALHRADEFTVAILELESGELTLLTVVD